MTTRAPAKATHHASPLRYPGGKSKLAPFLKKAIRNNRLLDCNYIEPFAGGAGAGLLLLLHGYVKTVTINDLSNPVFQFWRAALNESDRFINRIHDVELSVDEWKRQRDIFTGSVDASNFDLGFSTFYLNRTNRSGVLNGGIIGGHAQNSAYGINARFNRSELSARVNRLAKYRGRINVSNLDAVSLLKEYSRGGGQFHTNNFLYIDPPYYKKGRDLYYDYYKPEDHEQLRDAIQSLPQPSYWIVSYDNEPEIRALYSKFVSVEYDLSYSVVNGGSGREIMFISPDLAVDFVPEPGARRSARQAQEGLVFSTEIDIPPLLPVSAVSIEAISDPVG